MTKKDLKERCKKILNMGIVGACYLPPTIHFKFLISIFEKHQSWNIKRGAGVKEITTQTTKYGNRCFVIVRTDGSRTDISYIRSIDKPVTPESKIAKACRTAIHPTIRKYREDNVVYGVTKCPINGQILTKDNCHIDHYNLKFAQVLKKWLALFDVNDLVKHLNDCSIDGCIDVFFTDQSIIDNFIQFHNSNTHLRAVSVDANLGPLNRK